MAIAVLKRCPKCEGNLMLEKDNYGLYEQCLQCGYIHDLQIVVKFNQQHGEANKGLEAMESAEEIGPSIVPQTVHQLIETSLIESAPGVG